MGSIFKSRLRLIENWTTFARNKGFSVVPSTCIIWRADRVPIGSTLVISEKPSKIWFLRFEYICILNRFLFEGTTLTTFHAVSFKMHRTYILPYLRYLRTYSLSHSIYYLYTYLLHRLLMTFKVSAFFSVLRGKLAWTIPLLATHIRDFLV